MLVSDLLKESEDLSRNITDLTEHLVDLVRDHETDEAEKVLFKLKNKLVERNTLNHAQVEIVQHKRNVRE